MKQFIVFLTLYCLPSIVFSGQAEFISRHSVAPPALIFPHHKQPSPEIPPTPETARKVPAPWFPLAPENQVETMPDNEEPNEFVYLPDRTGSGRHREVTGLDGTVTIRVTNRLDQSWFQRQKAPAVLPGMIDPELEEGDDQDTFTFDESLKKREALLRRGNQDEGDYRGELEEQRTSAEAFRRKEREDPDASGSNLTPDLGSNMNSPMAEASRPVTGPGRPDRSLVYDGETSHLMHSMQGSYSFKDSKGRIHTTETVDEGAASSSAAASVSGESGQNCQICFEIPNNPHSCCGDERHAVCRDCADNWLRRGSRSCPACRMPAKLTLCSRLAWTINSMKARCPFTACKEIISIKDLAAHTELCAHYPKSRHEQTQYDQSTHEKINRRKRTYLYRREFTHLETRLDEAQQKALMQQLGFDQKLPFKATLTSLFMKGEGETFGKLLVALIAINADDCIEAILGDLSFSEEHEQSILVARQYRASELYIPIEEAIPLWQPPSSQLVTDFIAILQQMERQLSSAPTFYVTMYTLFLIDSETWRQSINPGSASAQEMAAFFIKKLHGTLSAMDDRQAEEAFTAFVNRVSGSSIVKSLLVDLYNPLTPLDSRLQHLEKLLVDFGQHTLQSVARFAGSSELISNYDFQLILNPGQEALSLLYPKALDQIAENLERQKGNEDEKKIHRFFQRLQAPHSGNFDDLASEKPLLHDVIHRPSDYYR